ncbi:PAS domain-containing protein [Microvirga arsenatis]|uniref:Blue-light-activated histidine kinase n=1 Tax=Microvirga arsenatis TaxID=2692265 RepID=A0ABW9Z350_9HYPH|nr:PAS domain-containing protein [Microvirga arsenatis]NBJ13018.1 PAS domain-containing protein [Microvirga arsenatis]NBJ26758.1 PAS domain-containing protein [Microvirga arsenatis]
MRNLIRTHDWSASPLRPTELWPQTLRTLTAMMLDSNQPMFVAWGSQRTLLYNDAYATILADRHPGALGRDFLEVWHEIRQDLLPLVEQVYRGEPVRMDDIALVMERRGQPEETHFSFFYSPVRDETGTVAGLFCACSETTRQVLAGQRLRESEERMRLAFAAGRLAPWEWDIGSGRVTWSGDLEAATGLEEQGFGGTYEAFLAVVHPADRSGVEAALRRALAGEAEYAAEFRMVRPDGSVRWTSTRGLVVRDRAGFPMRMIGYDADITERRRADERLGASEERFRSFAENSTDVLWIADAANGRLEYLSPAYEAIWGEPRERVMADLRRWAELVHPEDRERAREGLPRLLAGQTCIQEYRIVRPCDGAVRWIRDTGFPVRDGSGGVERVAGIAQDITDIKAAEAAHRESEAKFQAIANSIDQMIWSTRPDGYHDYYNQRWYDYTGVPEGSTDGEGWNGMFHPDDRERAWATWRHCLATGEPYHIEYRLRHRSGEYRWVIGRAQCVRDEEGRITRWYGTCTDIDDLKRTADELHRTSALLRLIGDSTPDMIYAKDRESRVLYANAAVRRTIGRPIEEILGRSDRDWAPSIEEAERIIANDRRVMETGDTFDVDEAFTGPDGETRYYRSVKSPLRDPTGAIIGLVGVTSDMTERRRAEERERLLAREVDHRAKNLLAVVQSVVQLTRGDDIAAFTDAVTGRIRSLARAHSLLAASRWEGADLRHLIEEELAPFRGQDSSRIRINGPAIRLRPEAAQALALVIHELTTNAAKYGALSAAGGRLDVTWALAVAGEEDGRLGLRWQERGGPSVAPPTRRGFGATIMRASVERQLQGKVTLDWNRDGLLCEMTIPAEQVTSQTFTGRKGNGKERTSLRGQAVEVRGQRILVLEDQAPIAVQIEEALVQVGCTVVGPASRIVDAMDLLYGAGADAALLDVDVAGDRSFGVADILAAKRIPFAFVTGFDASSFLPERFTGVPVLAKPFAATELISTVERLIRAGAVGTRLDRNHAEGEDSKLDPAKR